MQQMPGRDAYLDGLLGNANCIRARGGPKPACLRGFESDRTDRAANEPKRALWFSLRERRARSHVAKYWVSQNGYCITSCAIWQPEDRKMRKSRRSDLAVIGTNACSSELK